MSDSKQHEFTYLINLYTDMVGFPIVISTFSFITGDEQSALSQAAETFANELSKVLPEIQDRPGPVDE